MEAFKTANFVLIVLPTGMGKTVVFADIIRCMFPKRSMVIAHRKELITQARDKVKAVTGFGVEIEMGDLKSAPIGATASGEMFGAARATQVFISSIQTLTAGGGDGCGRMGKFDPAHFGLVVVDEAHHAPSASYRRFFDYIRAGNKNCKFLGVTATPDRADEEALGSVFEVVAFDYETMDAIRAGWLVPIFQQLVNVNGLDFSGVRTTAGDLNGADLAAVMESERALHGIAFPALEIIKDKSTLVFASSVIHAQTLSEIFNRHKPGSSNWVCGKTDPQERELINKKFISGELQILCNCGTHLEGFDNPRTEVIVMARPTKSRALYAQMIGRATRPLPGIVDGVDDPVKRRWMINKSAKPSCLVVDFVGNSGRHKLMNSGDILGGKVSDKILEQVSFRMRNSKGPMRVDQLIDEEQEKARQAEFEKRRIEAEARKAGVTFSARFSTKSVNPFDVLELQPVVERGWDKGRKLTEKQSAFLRRQGVDPNSLPYSQATQLIREMMGRFESKLCTYKQAKFLKKNGYETNIGFDDASKLITQIIRGEKPVASSTKREAQDVESGLPSQKKPRQSEYGDERFATISDPDDDVPF